MFRYKSTLQFMKTIISFIALALISIQLNAQTMKDIISSMPDSITPLLTKNSRLNLIDYLEAGQKAVEKNRLGGETVMAHLSETRCLIQMTSSSDMDFKLIKSPEPSIGVILSVHNSENTAISSIIKYYSLDWKLLKTVKSDGFTAYKWNDDNNELSATVYDPLNLKSEKFEK